MLVYRDMYILNKAKTLMNAKKNNYSLYYQFINYEVAVHSHHNSRNDPNNYCQYTTEQQQTNKQ